MIKTQLKKLNWTTYKFWKESGLPRSTAYEVANGKAGKAIIQISIKWLEEKIKTDELNRYIVNI